MKGPIAAAGLFVAACGPSGDGHEAAASDPTGGADAGESAPPSDDVGPGPRRWGNLEAVAGVNSEAYDTQATMSEDRLLICFASNRAGTLGGLDIYCAQRNDPREPFDEPVNQTAINSPARDAHPALTADGDEIFFASSRAGGTGGSDIYRARWNPESGRFEGPVEVAGVNSPQSEDGPAISGEVLLFASNRSGVDDIYAATYAVGSATEPVKLRSVSSGARDTEPALSLDQDFLVFCSEREGGDPAIRTTLWGAERRGEDWGQPEMLVIGDRPFAACGPSILSDGSLLFHTKSLGGRGEDDLFIAHPL